jgi:hypothetical protein
MGRVKYTPEIIEAIKEVCKGRRSAEIAQIINERFNTEFTPAAICSYMSEHRIQTGIQPWKKHATSKWRQLGAEKKKGGYIYTKVAQPNVWRLKHYIEWENHTGHAVQKDESLIFLDGDPNNTNFNNLYLVKRRIMRILNSHYPNREKGNAEKTKTFILLAQIKAAEIDRARQHGKLQKNGAQKWD